MALHYYALAWFTFAVTGAVRPEIISMKGEDVILRCEASSKPGVLYRSVIWYKVTKESEKSPRLLNGLVMKKLTKINSRLEIYKGVTRQVELLENSTNLFLPNVTVEDSGIYSCFLSAPLGHQNQEGDVHLSVYDDFIVEKLESSYRDPIYIVAFAVLALALLVMFISYVSLRNIFQNNKKSLKDSLWKMPHQSKELMANLQSKNLVCKTVPEVFV
ncbi:CD83 antigen [Triplophysa dalaica]|uniref:CD83 antigen n=1 Tax=Triplophysa dalaica TaxID=1582913 RepID=UPI0024DFDC8A|nr:CD83 antigen [Triplophysa dalaica]